MTPEIRGIGLGLLRPFTISTLQYNKIFRLNTRFMMSDSSVYIVRFEIFPMFVTSVQVTS